MLVLYSIFFFFQGNPYNCFEEKQPEGVHFVKTFDEIMFAKKVFGTISSSGGAWPDDMLPTLFLKRKADGKIFEIKIDQSGKYQLTDFPDGLYCYKIFNYGWDTIYGFIEFGKKYKKIKKDFLLNID